MDDLVPLDEEVIDRFRLAQQRQQQQQHPRRRQPQNRRQTLPANDGRRHRHREEEEEEEDDDDDSEEVRLREQHEEAQEVDEAEAQAEEAAAAAAAAAAAQPRAGAGRGAPRRGVGPPPLAAQQIGGARSTAPDYELVIQQLGPPQPRAQCAGCNHTKVNGTSGAYEEFKRFEDLLESNIALSDEIELSKVLAKAFESIRQKANQNRDPKLPEIEKWHASTIWFHYHEHIIDAGITRYKRLRQIANMVEAQYRKKCWEKIIVNGVECEVPNGAEFKTYRNMVELEAKMFADPRGGMFFSSGGAGVPSDDVRSMIGASRKRMHAQNVALYTGTSIAARTATAGVGSTVSAQGVKRSRIGSGM